MLANLSQCFFVTNLLRPTTTIIIFTGENIFIYTMNCAIKFCVRRTNFTISACVPDVILLIEMVFWIFSCDRWWNASDFSPSCIWNVKVMFDNACYKRFPANNLVSIDHFIVQVVARACPSMPDCANLKSLLILYSNGNGLTNLIIQLNY